MKAVSTNPVDIHVDKGFACASFAASGRREHVDSQFHAQDLLARCLQLESSALQLGSAPAKVEGCPVKVGELGSRESQESYMPPLEV